MIPSSLSDSRSALSALAVSFLLAACAPAAAPPAAAPAAGATPAPVASTAAAPQFTPLFNGKDLSGWVQVLDSKWVVESGALVGRQDPAGRREGESWLITEKDFGDYILKLKFRITQGGNSGVFLRDPVSRAERLAAADGGKGPWEAGYEVNINNDEPVYPTGSVWDAAKGTPKLQKENDWNDVYIKLQGQRISTTINGQVALDNAELPARTTRGGIGFQRHGTPKYRDTVIEFKDIEIAEL